MQSVTDRVFKVENVLLNKGKRVKRNVHSNRGHQGNVGAWSKVVLNAPGPLRSALIHTFGNFTQNVDQDGSGWTRRTRGTINPLSGPGVVFTFC